MKPRTSPTTYLLLLAGLGLILIGLALLLLVNPGKNTQETPLNAPHSSTPNAQTYSNQTFGFSFVKTDALSLQPLSSTLSTDQDGSKVLSVTSSDFSADLSVAQMVTTNQANGRYVIGLYRNKQLSNSQLISKTTTLPAQNFSFSLLDVNANPSYVSAFAPLTNTLLEIDFTSLPVSRTAGRNGTSYYQSDLPQSAKDFLSSFKKL